jgi:hypothetical protein
MPYLGIEATNNGKRSHGETDLDDEKQTPIRDRSVNVLYPKGNETAKCASQGCESEPVGKA